MKQKDDYELIDSGEGYKLERFGPYVLSRPCAQAVWKKSLPDSTWKNADASFCRIDDKRWEKTGSLPDSWEIETSGIKFKLSPTEFGHLGIFAEQKPFWEKLLSCKQERPLRVLNLFAYSGGSTLAAAKAGCEVCHLDASKGMVAWARENAALNNLANAPIRWIVEDVQKFIDREIRRESLYDVIVLDPPTFGRGAKGEVFKIETDIIPLLTSCKKLLTKKPHLILFSCHTPGFTPTALENLLKQIFSDLPGIMKSGEMLLQGPMSIPSGTYAYIDFQS
jgi:23S rRNA (cytosine1962-C5)-methyltransferase